MNEDVFRWQPATVAQKTALDSEAGLLFFGGSAGSLKSATLLMDAVQEYQNKNLRGIIFRSSYAEITDLLDKTNTLYPPLGGIYNGKTYTWRFPSGAQIRFGYIANDEDWRKYLGPRYSFIGWDESTFHTEKQVRNLLGRLSSTDKTLRLRCRLGSNPGGTGAAWHQEVFLRGHCPVHFPSKSAIPGKLYTDRYWPSDRKPIKASVTFIPGRLSDHNLLDDDYASRLDEMEGATAKAMLDGCWCSLDGAYFSFLNRDMVRPLGEVECEWWYSHFLALDFGYSGSSSSAGLYVRSPVETGVAVSIPGIRSSAIAAQPTSFPNGKIRKIGEIVEPHLPAYEFARRVVEAFIKPDEMGNRRRIVVCYLDPSNFKNIGDGHTIADQINEVFEPWDVACEPASNDRAGGWQLLYKMLKTGEFEITDGAPKTYEALRTRMHDPTKPNDIKKMAGDPLDDVADETRYGIYSFVTQAEKPRALVLAEAVKDLDITSAAIRYQQASEMLDRQEAPLRMGTRLGMRR